MKCARRLSCVFSVVLVALLVRGRGLRLGPRIAAGRYSYVARAGDDAILKAIPPEDDSADQQVDALLFWNGDGAVRVLRHDRERRVLLLERVIPGTDAATASEDDAIGAAVAAGRRIWRSPPRAHPFRTAADWVRRWLPSDDAHPLVPLARRTFEGIQPRSDALLHADLHHHNILRRDDEWVVIDPKPVVGAPEFDIPAFLWNPLGTPSTRARTERRIRAFADSGLDGELIRAWAIVRGVCDGLPLRAGQRDEDRPQLRVVRELL